MTETIVIEKVYTKREALIRFAQIYQEWIHDMIFDENTELGKIALFLWITSIFWK